jgi:hypothetical protein
MSTSYFENAQTLEDLKRDYRRLAFIYRDTLLSDIDEHYDIAFEKLKFIHRVNETHTYVSKEPSCETAEDFKYIITEISECFIYTTGNKKRYKNNVKKLKFQCKDLSIFLHQEYPDYVLDDLRRNYSQENLENF